MPIRYDRGLEEHQDILTRVMADHHDDLHDASVNIDILLAYGPVNKNGDTIGPAIKGTDGKSCAACVRITNQKERAAGRGDAEIILDADIWDESSPRTKEAIFSHELSHLALQTGKEGEVKRDDHDRPLLTKVEHTQTFGWFENVVRHYGKDSLEWQQAESFVNGTYSQSWLPGFTDDETEPVHETLHTAAKRVRKAG